MDNMKLFSQKNFKRISYFFISMLCLLSFINAQTTLTYSVAGATSWTVPSCVSSVTVQVFGGGGGGGGALAIVRNSSDGEACSGAGGGGGGGFSSSVLTVTPGQVYSVLVGAGGAGGISGAGTWNGGISTPAGPGGTGGTSSFSGNSYNVQATGGVGGNGSNAYNNNTPPDNNATGTGGSGGTGSGGSVNYTGGSGSAGYVLWLSTDKSGAGGGCAGPGGNGGNGTLGSAVGVAEAPGGIGQAPGGNGGNGRMNNIPANFNPAAHNGNIFGGGGGGALVHKESYQALSRSGGLGAVGAVIIRYTVPGSPGITSVSSPTITCTNPTVQSTITYTNGATTFTWSGPSIVSGGNTSIVSVNGPGVYSYTAAVGICTTTGSVQINSNTITPNVNASTSNTLTCTNFTVRTVASTTTTPVSYAWAGPGIVGGAGTASATVNAPGIYSYTVTNTSNGCNTTGMVAVTQNTSVVTATVAPTNSINCSSTTAQIAASTTATPVSYVWSGPGITGGAGTPTITVNQGGTYNYTITNTSNGCRTTGSQAISQNTTTPNVAAAGGSLTCLTTTANASATTASSPVTYNWSGPGITSATNISTITVNQGGTYTYTVSNTDNNCIRTGSVIINSNTTPPATTASLASVITCTSTTATLQGGPLSGVTYSWSGPGIVGATNQATATINAPGTYTLLTTSTVNGCTNTAVVTPTADLTPPQVNVVPDLTINCANPTATLQGSSSTTGATFSWTGPTTGTPAGATPTNSTSVVSSPGNYTLTVTNPANGCVSTAMLSVTSNVSQPDISVSGTQTITCAVTSTVISGGSSIPNVTYSWSPNGSAPTNSATTVNAGGNYTLTITNPVNNCTNTAVVSVVQNTQTPAVSTATNGVLNCTVTSVNASATTTTNPVTYNWSGSGITSATNISTITVNQGGTYTYTVTNSSNGCQSTGNVSVSQNTLAPSATAVGGTLTCSNTSTTLVGGPSSGVSYSWSGPGISGATNLSSATATATGNYTLTTTSTVNGCTNSAVASVTNNLTQPTANAGSTQTLVCGASSVTLIGSATPTNSSVNWLGGVCGSATSFTTSACGPGTYTLVVTHPTTGCTNTSTVSVTSSTNVPQATVNPLTNSITCTNSVVSIGVTLSNSDPVTYSWSGPGISGANNTAITTASLAGTYSVTITNTATTCQSLFNITVPSNTVAPVVTTNSSNTITCSTSSITVSATPTGTNYAYNWSGSGIVSGGTTQNPVVNTGGTYTVFVTDNNNGCVGTNTLNVISNTVTPIMTLSPSSLTTTCANPTATLLATSSADPDVNYVWTSPSTGSLNNTTINNPTASGSGIFTVQVTNTVTGCISAIETVTITADANIPTLTVSATSNTICNGASSDLSINGADTYSWSTTETTNTITVNPTTTTNYSVVATNTTTGCSNVANITVNVLPTLTLNIAASSTVICEGNSTTLTLSNATSYTVTNPAQTTTGTVTLNPTSTTTYTIVGESLGCLSNPETITINVNPLPQINSTNTITCAGSLVELQANGADVYDWQPGGANTNTFSVSPSSDATYSVTGTNTLTGCTSTVVLVNVTVNPLPTISASANPNTTCTTGTINLNASTTGTTSITSYTWSSGNGIDATNENQNNPSFPASSFTTGTYVYTVTATDANGCVSAQTTTSINIIDVPNALFDLSDLSICLNENGLISINNPQTGVTYDWSINGQVITNVNPLVVPSSLTGTSGTYTVAVLAGIGTCTNSAANTFTVNALPTVSLVNAQVSACENTSAQLDVAGPNTLYNYSWSNGTSTSAGISLNVNPLTQATAGEYTVTVVDQNGCINRTTGVVDAQICETYIPEIFTPNGDGKNDGFVIKNIENYPNNKLKIFNRWGNLVYQKDGYLNEFDGYANTGDQVGKNKLPAGTYYVILEYGDDKTETYNGYLLLQY